MTSEVGYHQQPHKRTSKRGKKFDAGRGVKPTKPKNTSSSRRASTITGKPGGGASRQTKTLYSEHDREAIVGMTEHDPDDLFNSETDTFEVTVENLGDSSDVDSITHDIGLGEPPSAEYTMDMDTYQVKWREKELGHPYEHISADWYEYEIALHSRETGELIELFDSRNDTYDGAHQLTESQ